MNGTDDDRSAGTPHADAPGPRRALIVEDEGLNVIFLTKALALKGYKVVGKANTGEQAVEQARQLSPDFVLMDVNLGDGMNGLEATRRIIAERPVPVIVVTAFSQADFVEEARRAGACGYVVKPVSADRLDSEIKQAFERFDSRTLHGAHIGNIAP